MGFLRTGRKLVISYDAGRGQFSEGRRDSFSVESVNVDSSLPSSVDCQQVTDSDNPESLRDSRNHSGNSESILSTQNELRDSRMNSETSENRGSEPAPEADSGSPQTIQTSQKSQTPQKEEEAEKSSEEKADGTATPESHSGGNAHQATEAATEPAINQSSKSLKPIWR